MKHINRDFFVTTLLILVAVSVGIGAWSTYTIERMHPISGQPDIYAVADLVIDHEVVGSGRSAVVEYAYRGDKLPEKLDPGELVELRTEASFTKDITGDADRAVGKYLYTTVTYPQQTFVNVAGEWFYIEYGRSPKDDFDAATSNILSWLFTTAYAADIFAGAGDGTIYSAEAAGWTDARSAATGDVADSTGVGSVVESGYVSDPKSGGPLYWIRRAFLPFDTSSIPASATITASTLNLYVTTTYDTDNDGNDNITVVETTQATHTTLTTADFDQCGSLNTPTEGTSSRPDITSISTSAYVTITLNATGLTWIKKAGVASSCTATTGITCLGIREGHDRANDAHIDNVLPTGVYFSASEETGTAQDPYLSVTYSGAFAPWQFQDF